MRKDPNQAMLDEFRRLPKSEQREVIISIASRCIDAAPPTLARRIEIYFDDES